MIANIFYSSHHNPGLREDQFHLCPVLLRVVLFTTIKETDITNLNSLLSKNFQDDHD